MLVVDLNNFAYYPTIAVGYLVAVLRRADCRVEVLSPLMLGVPSGLREKTEGWIDHVERRVSYSTRPWIEGPRRVLGGIRARGGLDRRIASAHGSNGPWSIRPTRS